jgi:hypothetical protein
MSVRSVRISHGAEIKRPNSVRTIVRSNDAVEIQLPSHCPLRRCWLGRCSDAVRTLVGGASPHSGLFGRFGRCFAVIKSKENQKSQKGGSMVTKRCHHCHFPLSMRRGGQEYMRCVGCDIWLHRDTRHHVRVCGSCYQAHAKVCPVLGAGRQCGALLTTVPGTA